MLLPEFFCFTNCRRGCTATRLANLLGCSSPGGQLVLVYSLQRGDEPDYEGLLDLFPQNYYEPYYPSYTTVNFRALAADCGLTHIRDVKAFVSKVM
jgi:hypothetical protein